MCLFPSAIHLLRPRLGRAVPIRGSRALPCQTPVSADLVLAVLCRDGDTPEVIRGIVGRLSELGDPERNRALVQLGVLAGLRGAGPLLWKEAEAMPITIRTVDLGILREPVQAFVVQAEARGEVKERLRLSCEFLARRHAADLEVLRADLSTLSEQEIAATWDRALSSDDLDEILQALPGRSRSYGH